MTRYFAGIDSGTQSTKVLIVDDDGIVTGRGQAAYGLIDGLPAGHKEQHPKIWVDALKASFSQALATAGIAAEDVAGIGVSGQQHGFVPLDVHGDVIRPAKLWCDTSTATECDDIMNAVGGRERYQDLIGNSLPAGFTASKILWLKRNEPDNFAKLDCVLLPHDYLNFRLTGERRMEWGDASGTGLMDVRKRVWSEEVAAVIDEHLPGNLPPLEDSAVACGHANGDLAVELGVSPAAIVSSGGGDNMMGAIGTGNTGGGVVTVSLGTSGTIYACTEDPVIDTQGEIAAFCDSTGKWLPLLCTMNVTVSTELTRGLFGMDVRSLNETASKAPAGCDGLILVPYFEGERTPNVPDGTGVWFGFRPKTASSAHFARAAMEGATMGLGYGLNRMKQLGLSPSEIRLTGGGSKSALWRRIVANVFNTSVVCTREAEGAAFGAAIQARWAVERQSDANFPVAEIVRQWVMPDEETRCYPDSETVERYEKLQQLHNEVSRELRTAFATHYGIIS